MNVTLVAMNAMYQHTSLALRLLDKAVEGLPIRHTVLELHVNMREEAMLRAVYETHPDVIGFSCFIWNISLVLPLARKMKQLCPESRIILGGSEVSYTPLAYLSENPQIDAIVCGEGEIAYRLLLEAYLQGGNGGDILGVCLRGASSFTFSKPVPVSDQAACLSTIYDPARIWYAETSRGCPFACHFCVSSIQPGVRALEASSAVAMLRWMADHGAKLVKLVDRSFNHNPARAIDIWRGLFDTTGDCVFHFEIEPNLLDDETLRFLSAVPKGKFQFEIGIQSTNPKTLRAIARRLNQDKVSSMLQTLHGLGTIPLHLDLIAGLPYEDFASFARSFDETFMMKPTVLQVGFLKLLPGTKLRLDAAQYGIVYAKEAPYEVLYTDCLSYDELLNLKDIAKTVEWYYNADRYQATIALLFKYHAPFFVFDAIAKNLRGKGIFDAPRNQAQRLAALLAAAYTLVPEQDIKYLLDTIRFDALLQDLPPTQWPDECPRKSAEEKLLREKHARYNHRAYAVARFCFDIPALIQDRRLIQKEITLCIQRKKSVYFYLP